jgi:hypothetical protein
MEKIMPTSDQLGAAAAAMRSAAMPGGSVAPDVLAALGDLIADAAGTVPDAAEAAPAAAEATLAAARLIARLGATAAARTEVEPLPTADDAAARRIG